MVGGHNIVKEDFFPSPMSTTILSEKCANFAMLSFVGLRLG